MGGKGIDLAGDPVVEPGANGDKEVALRDREVRILGAMHAEHPEIERIIAGDTPETHKCRRDRDAELGRKCDQFFRRV